MIPLLFIIAYKLNEDLQYQFFLRLHRIRAPSPPTKGEQEFFRPPWLGRLRGAGDVQLDIKLV